MTRVAAILALAVLGVAACESQPSAKRVAEDLIDSLDGVTDEQRACMLDKLDGYTKSELDEIGKGVTSKNAGTKAESVALLEEFEAALADCRR